MPDKSGPDLISASDLFSALVRVKVTSPGEVICIYANAGRLRSYAENLTVSEKDVPPDEEIGGGQFSTIPRAFWWAQGGAALEQNWSANIFSTRLTCRGNNYSRGNDPYSSSGKDQVRMQALGVCFNLADVLKCFPALSGVLSVDAPADKKPPLSEAKIREWMERHPQMTRELNEPALLGAIGAAFPDSSVSRDRFRKIRRELVPDLKTGPKT